MPSRRKVHFCRCAHEQNLHAKGFGACRCGCTEFRLRGRGPVVRILACLDPGQTVLHPTRTSPGRPTRAPLFQVACPECGDVYEARAHRRQLVVRRRCRRCADGLKLVGKLTRTKPRAERPADMPKPEAFANRPHGTRLRYLSGCRCDDCRGANAAYARMRAKIGRAGGGNGFVDAARVRAHLERLSQKGIGRRTVHDISGVSETVLRELRIGRQRRVRVETGKRILAVSADAISDGHRVRAETTWNQLHWLLKQGFTKRELARRLGATARLPKLQIQRHHVNARTAQKVARLYKEHHG